MIYILIYILVYIYTYVYAYVHTYNVHINAQIQIHWHAKYAPIQYMQLASEESSEVASLASFAQLLALALPEAATERYCLRDQTNDVQRKEAVHWKFFESF